MRRHLQTWNVKNSESHAYQAWSISFAGRNGSDERQRSGTWERNVTKINADAVGPLDDREQLLRPTAVPGHDRDQFVEQRGRPELSALGRKPALYPAEAASVRRLFMANNASSNRLFTPTLSKMFVR